MNYELGCHSNVMESQKTVTTDALVARIVSRRARFRQRLDSLTFRWRHIAIASAAGAILVGVVAFLDPTIGPEAKWFGAPAGAVIGSGLYALFLAMVRDILRGQLRGLERDLASAGVEILQEALEEDFFTKLVKINFKYIDQYYLQTQSQADKSFTLCVAVAVVGFVILAPVLCSCFVVSCSQRT